MPEKCVFEDNPCNGNYGKRKCEAGKKSKKFCADFSKSIIKVSKLKDETKIQKMLEGALKYTRSLILSMQGNQK
ncbi:MAG: hypothetical protein JW812_03340 [Alphaproteobacteria bacterium]|nr:hypothetical protein [Alphaproteobacteria bacterium]MBN2780121.1 hypothetical protein [Alphaproteobacteria bacterium]